MSTPSDKMNVDIVRSDYLVACARIRNITVSALVRKLIQTIDRDQLVLAILDDDSQHQRGRYEHRFRTSVWGD